MPGFNQAAEGFLTWLYGRDDIIIDNGPLGERVRTIEQVFPDGGDTEFNGVLDSPLTVSALEGVTGHSLGGHLSSALTRLVPGVEALTVNGAGYATAWPPGLGGDAALNIANLFSMLGGAPSFDTGRTLNLYGDKMPEFVTQDGFLGLPGGLFQPGGHEPVYIEQDPWTRSVLGHGGDQMTDALAVHDLFIDVVPALLNGAPGDVLSTLGDLLEASAPQAGGSFETTVNAVGDLFLAGDEINTQGDRDQLYKRINAIKDSLEF